MQRVVILGNAGSGKSTLARAIGARLGLPVVHLDRLFWSPGWREPDPETFREQVRQAVAGQAWVCEGNYARRTFDLRLPQAQWVIWLEMPRTLCLMRVLLRSLWGRKRADRPEGCRDRLDRAYFEFLRFVWTFDRAYRAGIEAQRQAVAPQVPVVRLRGRRAVARFLAGLPERVDEVGPVG